MRSLTVSGLKGVEMKWLRVVFLLFAVSAQAETVKTIKFCAKDKGEQTPIRGWGIDNTWVSWNNTQESIRNAGELIDFVRVGFYLTEPYQENGHLSDDQEEKLRHAIETAELVDKRIPIMLTPHNEEGIIDWYKDGSGNVRIDRWLHVMEQSRKYIKRQGHKVLYVEAFNEPDYADWNMGTKDDLNELFERLEDWGVVRVGPSVMNSQWAESWYDEVEDNLDAGSTHTLYGTMEQFIDFIKTVKRDRKLFFCAESHSIAEAMVGLEYGMDYLMWWAEIDEGRGHFMRASQGDRLAYVEVEDNWSAACVYRDPDDELYGFAGTAERENGITTTYKFVCTDKDVTYCVDGDEDNGEFREKGEPFEVTAKPPDGDRSIWLRIVSER